MPSYFWRSSYNSVMDSKKENEISSEDLHEYLRKQENQEWLHSFKMQSTKQHQRFMKRFLFSSKRTLLSKGTKSSTKERDKLNFQEEFLDEMKSQNKRFSKVDNCCEMTFNIGQRNAPTIEKLPKYYLDLIQEPHSDLETYRKRLGIDDDSIISYLHVKYYDSRNYKDEESELTLTLYPHSQILLDLKFCEFIIQNPDECEISDYDIEDYLEEHKYKYRDNDDTLELYNETLRKLENVADSDEKNRLLIEKFFYQFSLQKEFLEESGFDLKKYLLLLNHQMIETKPINPFMKQFPNQDYKQVFVKRPTSINVENLTFDKDQSDERLKKIDAAIDNYMDRYGRNFPLFNMFSLTIFFIPPENKDPRFKDIDNVAREVIKAIAKKITPTNDFIYPEQDGVDHSYKDLLQTYPVEYQVIRLLRSEKDDKMGTISVHFHDLMNHQSLSDSISDFIRHFVK